MIDQNTLSQWMNFYKQNMPGVPVSGFGYESAMNSANNSGRALDFALRMAGPQGGGMPQGMPQQTDYFKGLGGPQAGVTIGDNPYSSKVNQLMAMQAQTPQPSQMGNNYLARMFR